MQVNISQEPFCTETDRKSARAQKLGAHFVQACAVEMQVNISQEPLYMEIYRKNAAVQIEPQNADTHTLCEAWRSRNASQHFTRATLYGNFLKFTGKCRGPRPRRTLCASLRSRHAPQHFHKSHFIRKFTGKMPRPRLSPERRHIDIHFARACAAEMQVNISQEPIYREIYREKARPQSGHPDQAPAFILTVRTLDCGHAVLGKKCPKQIAKLISRPVKMPVSRRRQRTRLTRRAQAPPS